MRDLCGIGVGAVANHCHRSWVRLLGMGSMVAGCVIVAGPASLQGNDAVGAESQLGPCRIFDGSVQNHCWVCAESLLGPCRITAGAVQNLSWLCAESRWVPSSICAKAVMCSARFSASGLRLLLDLLQLVAISITRASVRDQRSVVEVTL